MLRDAFYTERFDIYLYTLKRRKEKSMVKVQQRGLGKGLSALISENYSNAAPQATTGDGTPNGVGTLPITLMVPGKFQPRIRFDETQLKELSASIRKNGVMQPIIVRPIWRDGKAAYEIVAGERRWRAATMAGLESIPAIIREINDQQALELALIENVQRADLSPLEEAAGYKRLMDEFRYTQEELGIVVGKSRAHIANLLRLLTLPDDIRSLLEEGKLSAGHARALLTSPNASNIARAAVEKGLSVRQVEILVSGRAAEEGVAGAPRGKAGAKPAHEQTAKDPDIMGLEITLSDSLGMPVTIDDHNGSGTVSVAYESLAQLDVLLQKLGGSA